MTGADATDPSAGFRLLPRHEERLSMAFQHRSTADVRDLLLETASSVRETCRVWQLGGYRGPPASIMTGQQPKLAGVRLGPAHAG